MSLCVGARDAASKMPFSHRSASARPVFGIVAATAIAIIMIIVSAVQKIEEKKSGTASLIRLLFLVYTDSIDQGAERRKVFCSDETKSHGTAYY